MIMKGTGVGGEGWIIILVIIFIIGIILTLL